jgi:RNA polymerase sigma-70 factor (ECF subfamily)
VDPKQLLIQLKNADDHAFRQLFERYVKRVYQFVYNHIKDKTEAEDITQNVFIRIWEKKEMIDPNRSFEGFIFTIAYRLLIDYYRANARRFGVDPMDGFAETTLQSTLHTDDLVHHHQLESLYQQALLSLPPKRKEIFLLSRHNGLSNREIAEKMGISVKTVESQMTAALGFLRDFFDRTEMGPAAVAGIYFLLG